MHRRDERTRRAGSILIVVLWSLSLLTTFAVSLGYSVRQKLVLADRLDENDTLRLIAEAGVKKAIAGFTIEAGNAYDALAGDWSNNPRRFSDIQIGAGVANVCYDYIDESGTISTRYGFVDEARKININTADMPTLRRLLRAVLGLDTIEAQDLAASIVDWRDGDSELSVPMGSAEDSYYRGLRYPYESKDSNFEIPEELLLVKGVTKDIFNRLKDYITIYGSGRINVNTAPEVVLMVIGLRKSVAKSIITFRAGPDKIAGTLDDGVFVSVGSIIPTIERLCTLGQADINKVQALADTILSTTSENFTIRSVAHLNNRKNALKVDCVIDREGEVLNWRES
jgi:Type II secretory pathway, component PulK